MSLYYTLATYYHWTDYNGLVDIYLNQQKKRLQDVENKRDTYDDTPICYCHHCMASPDVMYAYYYSCLKNNNIKHGKIFLSLVDSKGFFGHDYRSMGHDIVKYLETQGIEGNISLFYFYISSASIEERKGKLSALYPEFLKLALQKARELDAVEYDSAYSYDDDKVGTKNGEIPMFLTDHKVNPEFIAFLESISEYK